MTIQKRLSMRAGTSRGFLGPSRLRCLRIFLLSGTIFYCGVVHAAQDEDDFHYEKKVSIKSGRFDGNQSDYVNVYTTTIAEPDVPWMRIHFKKWNLGESSYIQMTSMKDGGMQKLDATSIEQWGGYSAYFDGDTIELELFVAPEDSGVFVRVDRIIAGKWRGDEGGISVESLCGEDDRVRFSDPAVGRFYHNENEQADCTVWLTMDALLTAGHCEGVYSGGFVVEFNVKESHSDGTPKPSKTEDQYPVVAGSGVFRNYMTGDDWGIFRVHPNSNTNLLPIEAQNAFYRVSNYNTTEPVGIKITGCGLDDGEDNQTIQTDSCVCNGDNCGWYCDLFHSWACIYTYRVDTQPGNSGSPIIETGENVAVGLHTNGGCPNSGTGFQNVLLYSALNTYSPQFVFVDSEHPAQSEEGTVFEPYKTVTDGVSQVVSGGIVRIAEGVYNEATLFIDEPMEIEALAGEVSINGKLTIDRTGKLVVKGNGVILIY